MSTRKDYGPAGCADGCASRSAGVIGLFLLLALTFRKRRK